MGIYTYAARWPARRNCTAQSGEGLSSRSSPGLLQIRSSTSARCRQARSSEDPMDLFSTSPSEAYSLVRSCINCTMPANLLATFALIVMGAGLVTYVERRKAILLKTRR